MTLVRYRLWLRKWPPACEESVHSSVVQFEPPFVVVALAHREIERSGSARDSHELFGGIDDGEID